MTLSQLPSIDTCHCVLLTGTPLQNKTEELWALLNFADPSRFVDSSEFIHNFGDLKDSKQVAKLHETLKPFLLRRIKEDVEKSLPPKEETIVEVALTSVQKRFYRAIYEKNTSFLFKGVKASNQPSLMNVMMELRKCCNHPFLIRGVEDKILSDAIELRNTTEAASAVVDLLPSSKTVPPLVLPVPETMPTGSGNIGKTERMVNLASEKVANSARSPAKGDLLYKNLALYYIYLIHLIHFIHIIHLEGKVFASDEVYHRKLVESSGKLVLLEKLLPRLQSQGHKVNLRVLLSALP